MDYIELMTTLSQKTPSKIILLVLDGLGGLPLPETGKTELETAFTPNLDALAKTGVSGLSDPIAPGITPGSAPGHLGLFGYDPVAYNPGRGVLEATGIDFPLETSDIAVRGNFCTVNEKGLITDRRAGRISNETCAELAGLLNGQVIDGVTVFVQAVKEHRFVAVFRGEGLVQNVTDSDPQGTGVPPLPVKAKTGDSAKLAKVANAFIAQSAARLADHAPANMLLLRGFSSEPGFPSMADIYKLTPAAVAGYPMYRGLARLAGMKTLDTGSTIESLFATVKNNYNDFDFFFVHVKPTDSAGEDGDFQRKVAVLEEV
ncbi:MAG: phosphoglycerate mutase, partial [Dehalococcoidales bacterium]|nr:phosphoglycerate mutase [Dehalococcoidales bacterium]